MSYVEDAPVVTAAADYAELVVEWLPTCSPFVSDGDWCDITAYVASWDVKSGKDYFTDSIQTGTGKIVIRSSDRLFDSNNTAGPFFPWLTPMRQVRIREVWSGTDYTTWRGYITDYGETTLGADSLWETTLSVSDAWELAEHITLPSSYYEMIVSQDVPDHWYRLDESAGQHALDSGYASNVLTGTYRGATPAAVGVVPFDGGRTCANCAAGHNAVDISNAIPTSTNWTLEAWFAGSVATGSAESFALSLYRDLIDPPSTNPYLLVSVDGNGRASLRYQTTSTTDAFITSTATSFGDGLGHHVVVTWQSASNTLSFYADGVFAGSATPTGSLTLTKFELGGHSAYTGITTPGECSVQDVAVYERLLTAAQVLDHYNAGANAFEGDDTGEHIGRALDAVGWPTNLRSLGMGVSTVGAYDLSGESLREYVTKMGDTELGQTYVSNDGKITHRARSSLYLDSRSSTSQATFGDAHSSATLKFDDEDFSFPKDNTKIRNPVNAARSGGVTATARDDQLIQDTYANRAWDAPTAYDDSDNVMPDRANWLLERHKEAHTRLESMRISPRRDPSNLWPQVLGRKIGDRITIERTPLGTGNQISSEQIIQSVRHAGTPKQRRAWYTATPDELTIPWILGDATYSVLGSTTVLGY